MADAATPLTPDLIRQTTFGKAFRGYDKAAVDKLVGDCVSRLESLTKERADLEGQVVALEKELTDHRDAQGLMRDALLSAQRAAEELKARTQKECEEMLERARADARDLEANALVERARAEADVKRLRLQEQELKASYKVLLHAALDRLGSAGEEAEGVTSLLEALAPRRVGAPEAAPEQPESREQQASPTLAQEPPAS